MRPIGGVNKTITDWCEFDQIVDVRIIIHDIIRTPCILVFCSKDLARLMYDEIIPFSRVFLLPNFSLAATSFTNPHFTHAEEFLAAVSQGEHQLKFIVSTVNRSTSSFPYGRHTRPRPSPSRSPLEN